MTHLITVEQARIKCRITFLHAMWLISQGYWTPIRTGPGSKTIRIRLYEVEDTIKRWADTDRAAKDKLKASGKYRRAVDNAAS